MSITKHDFKKIITQSRNL